MVRVREFSNLGNSRYGGQVIPDEAITFANGNKIQVRGGGCRQGCGLCCEYVIVPIDRRVLHSDRLDDWEKWLNIHGIEMRVTPERCEIRIPVECKWLLWDKSCGIHDDPERPEMCGRFPATPVDILDTGLEEACSYTWKAATPPSLLTARLTDEEAPNE